MFIPANPGEDVRTLRQIIYTVLRINYPLRMTAAEIANDINNHQQGEMVTPAQVTYAIRYFALQCKHFSVFPIDGHVRYSIYILDPPFDAWGD